MYTDPSEPFQKECHSWLVVAGLQVVAGGYREKDGERAVATR
jgi:hypothetical protein